MKIVFTGPESTGKTTLSSWLSNEAGIPLVSEMARIYLQPIGLDYTAHHVREIGLLQHFEENQYKKQHKQIICDTDLLTILIWLEVKFNIADDHLLDLWLSSPVDLYFLCMPDIPWVDDPLRESPLDRDQLSGLYKKYLIKYQKTYAEVSGPIIQRQEIIKSQMFEVCGIRF